MVRLVDFDFHDGNGSGDTYVFEHLEQIPGFSIERAFWVKDVPKGLDRAGHAQAKTDEVLFAIAGSVDIEITDRYGKVQLFQLYNSNQGLFVEHGNFIVTKNFSPDCVLIGLVNRIYDSREVIQGYSNYLSWIEQEDEG
jgi:dTDP-4-dehydrorhamnose 3,5-epimerase-like enzyme